MNDTTKRLLLADSALDALLDYTHQIPQEQRFSFLTRTLNKLSFAKAINDNDVKHVCNAVAAKLRQLHAKAGGAENSRKVPF